MNKLGEKKYVMGIADVLAEVYGSSLKEYGTDVKMAEAVVEYLREYLYFHSLDISKKEFDDWKNKRDLTNMRYCNSCEKEFNIKDKPEHMCNIKKVIITKFECIYCGYIYSDKNELHTCNKMPK